MSQEFEIITTTGPATVKADLLRALANWKHVLPQQTSAAIVLKPNFNSNMNALTGNTTDLRVIAAVVEFLQSCGYSDITVCDGPSSGFARARVSVMHRLKIDRLVAHYGIKMIDINTCTETISVPLASGGAVQVPTFLANAGFIINLPKIKTHCEAGMSGCLKNLVGVCVGLANKLKMHMDLPNNILKVNEVIRPGLHVVDGNFAMEGNGPSAGTPVNLGKMLIGTNPFQLDYLCARIIGFPITEVKTLKAALDRGIISEEKRRAWDAIDLGKAPVAFQMPHLNFLASLVMDNRKASIWFRNTWLGNLLTGSRNFKKLLLMAGISQEVLNLQESDLSYKLDRAKCTTCGKCTAYCPQDLTLDQIAAAEGKTCLGCLYCFSVCPDDAISLVGNRGFFAVQMEKYDAKIRSIA
jgi:uncharacterized protein (DUF362 family)/ferredoxin